MAESTPATTQTTTPPPAAAQSAAQTQPPAPAIDAAAAAKKAAEAEQIRQRGLAIKKQREEELAKLRGEVESLRAKSKQLEEFEAWKKQATLDPDQFLKPVYGEKWYETLTKAKLGDDSNVQIRALRDELRAELEKERAARLEAEGASKKALEEQKAALQKEAEAAEAEWRAEVEEHIKANGEKYAGVAALGMSHVVAMKAKDHFERTGKVLSQDEAAAAVEEALDNDVKKLLATPKWQKWIAEQQQQAKPANDSQPLSYSAFTRSTPRSVSNDMRPQPSAPPARLSREEKMKRVVAQLDEMYAGRK